MRRVVIIGNPGSRRVALFQNALSRAGRAEASVLSWLSILDGSVDLESRLSDSPLLRIESPGEDWEVERALIAAGADCEDAAGPERITRSGALALRADRGRILFPRQWFLGFRAVLRRIERVVSGVSGVTLMNHPDDVVMMFDKPVCHRLLASLGVPVPEAIGPARSYDELRESLRAAGMDRAFVKPAHGSSASGVVALSVRAGRESALTSAELASVDGRPALYNNLRLRRYTKTADIAAVLNLLCREGVHVERWLPKAHLSGAPFDVRVVTIRGRARHVLPRLGRGPITNLHLGNRRGSSSELVAQAGEKAWALARAVCESVAAAFPRSLYAGIDLLLEPGFRRPAVLEVNAFGDLLPGLLDQGQDTYDAELAEALAA